MPHNLHADPTAYYNNLATSGSLRFYGLILEESILFAENNLLFCCGLFAIPVK